jgi:hypothetical protein
VSPMRPRRLLPGGAVSAAILVRESVPESVTSHLVG